MPDVREKLVDIVQRSVGGCSRYWAGLIADGMIANGVTIQRYGRWIPHNKGQNNWVECSVCNTVGSPFWKCCPVCETKMAQPPKGE